jgi:hypothetical protein
VAPRREIGDMSVIRDIDIVGRRVQLDGNSFTRVTFRKCRLVLTGQAGFSLKYCTFDACSWAVEGPASTTLQALKGLYQIFGMAPIIERTFDTIRGRTAPLDRRTAHGERIVLN